jgi:nucleoside-diphosphate-sugar epimerase
MGRVFITGGSGFIGTNLIDSFLKDGWEVRNFDLAPPRKAEHEPLWHCGDIRHGELLRASMRDYRPAAVVHLAARTDLDGASLQEYSANTEGVKNLIESIRGCPTVQRALFASSRYVHRTEIFPARDDEYSPFTLYGESKVETERIVRSSGLDIPWTLLRPTSIWGPWFRIPYRTFFDTVRRGLYLHPRGMRIAKSYGYAGNVVHQMRGILAAEAARVNRRTLYLSDDHEIEVLEFAQAIRQAFSAPPVRQAPLAVMKTMAAAGDGMKRLGYRHPPLTSFRLKNILAEMHYDLSATTQIAGPAPYTLSEGVQETVEWIQRHG